MKTKLNRFLSMLLCLAMILGMVPAFQLVAQTEATEQAHETHTQDQLTKENGWIEVNSETKEFPTEGKVWLSSNITLSSTVTVAANAELHLCLNGFAIDVPAGMQFVVRGTMTLCDKADGDGKIQSLSSSANKSTANGLITVSDKFYMYGGAITGHYTTGYGGGVRVDGEFTMYNGTISNNTTEISQGGGGIYVAAGGTFTMKGGQISGNSTTTAWTYGGGGAISGCTYNANVKTSINIEGGVISGNSACRGGAICLINKIDLTISGSASITNNNANGTNDGGGAICATQQAAQFGKPSVTIKGGTISGNTANASAGAVYISSGSMLMTGGTIEENEGKNNAGGIFVKTGAELTVNGGEIRNNRLFGEPSSATEIFNGGTLNINGGTITANYNTNGTSPATYGIRVAGESFNMTSGSITGTPSAALVFLHTVNSATISGTAQSGEAGILLNGNENNVSIEKLEYGAEVYVIAAPATNETDPKVRTDDTVRKESEESVTVNNQIKTKTCYQFNEKEIHADNNNNCGEHKGHGGWTNVSEEYLAENAFPASGKVALTGDVTLNDTVTVSDGETLHLCLNGHTVNVAAGKQFIVNGTMTLCDGDRGEGTITGNAESTVSGLIYVNGTFDMHGGTITGHTTTVNGAGVFVNSGRFTMHNGTITGNTSEATAGAVYINAGTMEMNGGTIEKNVGKTNAGGIFVAAGATMTVNGGTIQNHALTNENQKYNATEIYNCGTLNINGGTIIANEDPEIEDVTNYAPNAIKVAGATAEFNMSGGSVTGTVTNALVNLNALNKATISGTAQIGEITIISNNVETKKGGLLFAGNASKVTLRDLRPDADIYAQEQVSNTDISVYCEAGTNHYIFNETAYNCGCHNEHAEEKGWTKISGSLTADNLKGYVYLEGNATIDNEVTITDNVHLCLNGYTITVAAGKRLIVGSSKTLDLCDRTGDGKILGNSGSSVNGLIKVEGALNMYGGTITGHSTSNYGAGVVVVGGTFTMHGGKISGNTTTNAAGGVYILRGSMVMNGGTIENNQGASGTGGITVGAGGSLTVNGGTIQNNVYTGTGTDASEIYCSGTLNVNGGTINASGNSSNKAPYTIKVAGADAKFNMTGGLITGTPGTALVFLHTIASSEVSGTAKIVPEGGKHGLYTMNNADKLTIGALEHGAYIRLSDMNDPLENLNAVDPGVKKIVEGTAHIYTFWHADTTNSCGTHEGSDWINVDQAYVNKNGFPVSGNVALIEDITLDHVVVAAKTELHLCLNGHTITMGNNSGTITEGLFDVNGTLILCDSEKGTGELTCDEGTSTMRNRGFFNVSGAMKMYGGTLTGHVSQMNGGAIYIPGGSFTMYGGKIEGNESRLWNGANANGYGGGILVNGGGLFTMYGGSIEGNEGARGAGVGLINGSKAVIHDGQIINNHATDMGAAIWNFRSSVVIKGGTFDGNTCGSSSDSSVIYGGVKIMGGSFNFNGNTTYGIRAADAALEISGGTFTGNSTYLVYSTGKDATCTISGNPVIEGSGVTVNSNLAVPAKIENLKLGAKIYSPAKIAYDDTAAEEFNQGVYTYTYKVQEDEHRFVGKCGTTHVHGTALKGEVLTLNAGSYYLNGDVNLTAPQTISGEVHICLNGYTIKGAAAPYFTVSSGATLTICDCKGGGKIDGSTVANSPANGLIWVKSGSTFNFHGGTITGHTTTGRPGGVLVNGTMNMYAGAAITGCKTVDTTSGGAIFTEGGTFNMYGGEITKNEAYYGGAIYITAQGTVTIHDGLIAYNKAANGATDGRGGAIYNVGKLTIKGSVIRDNTAVSYGGAIFSNSTYGTLTLEDGLICDNTAGTQGGAIYGALTMNGGKITGNTAPNADAIRLDGGTFTMTGGQIFENTVSDTADVLIKGNATAVIRDTAVIDEGGIEGVNNNNVTIQHLQKGASIYAKGGVTGADDGTYQYDEEKQHYSWKKYASYKVDLKIDSEKYTGNQADPEDVYMVEPNVSELQLSADLAEGTMVDDNKGFRWSVVNHDGYNAVTVDQSGKVTFRGDGAATVTAVLLDKEGKETDYFASVRFEKGDILRVLAIGNDSSRDSMYYLDSLAKLTGNRIQAAYLYLPDNMKDTHANLRDHAKALSTNAPIYDYYITDLETSQMKKVDDKTTGADILEAEDWDVVILQHGTTAGWPTTYNADLEYLIDYVRGEEPDTELYWNMNWANELGCDTGYAFFDIDYDGTIDSGYDGNPLIMYNAIVNNMNHYIQVNGENENDPEKFDGLILTGATIQKLRGEYELDTDYVPAEGDTIAYKIKYTNDDNWTRDGYHLSLKRGRLAAAMTMLKALCDDVNLDNITVEDLDFLVADDHDQEAMKDSLLYTGVDTEYESKYRTDDGDVYLNEIIQAVNTVSAWDKPEELDLPRAQAKTEDHAEHEDSETVLQTDLPVAPRFPDVITLNDGSQVAAATLHIGHATWPEHGLREGSSKVVVFRIDEDSKDWRLEGKAWYAEEDFDKGVLLVIDEAWAEENVTDKNGKKVAMISGRYDRIKDDPSAAGTEYVAANFGDFNMEYFQMDMNNDGQKEQVLWATVSVVLYPQDGAPYRDSYFVWSTDNGENWTTQKYTDYKEQPSLKRGDAAVFEKEGMIMTTGYGYDTVGAALWQWNNTDKKFKLVAGGPIPNTAPEENGETWGGGEIALITLDEETVYGFCRPSGVVYKMSMKDVERRDNYKWNIQGHMWDENIWEEIANEDGLIHQPVFTKLDDTHILVNYAGGDESPRDVYGHILNINADWTDYETVKIHDYDLDGLYGGKRDTGNPGSTLLNDGRILVVHYDAEYNSLIADYIDLNLGKADFDDYKPRELMDNFGEEYVMLPEITGNELADGHTMESNVSGTHTIHAAFTLDGGSVTIKTVAGNVTIKTDSVSVGGNEETVELDAITNAAVTVVGTDLYVKVWGENAENAKLLYFKGTAAEVTGISAEGNATLNSFKVTKRMQLELKDLSGILNAPDIMLDHTVLPKQAVTWESDNDGVVTVTDGNIHFVNVGTATVTMTVGGHKISRTVTVKEPPLELSKDDDDRGVLITRLDEKFDGFTADGEKNNFLTQLWAAEESDRKFYVHNPNGEIDVSKLKDLEYNIVQGTDGNYLEVKGGYGGSINGSPWFMFTEELTGDYTVQFDYRFHEFTGNSSIFYTNLWQMNPMDDDDGVLKANEYDIQCSVNFRPGGMQYGYRADRIDKTLSVDELNEVNPTITYENGWTLKGGEKEGTWGTVKIARINGAVFTKFWAADDPEPEQWDNALYADVLKTSVPAYFRFQPYSNTATLAAVDIDNIKITQRKAYLDTAGKTLTLGGLTSVNAYYKLAEGISENELHVTDGGVVTNAGVLVWDEYPTDSRYSENVTRKDLVQAVDNEGNPISGEYKAVIDSMPAARYRDKVYYRSYIDLGEGQYEYGDLVEYSVEDYCKNMLSNSETTEELKKTLVAKLYYGGAAEDYFETGDSAWVEELLKADQKEMLETAWTDDQLTPATPAVENMISGLAKNDVSDYGKTLSLKDNVYINFYFKSDEKLENAKVYFWTADKYDELKSGSETLSTSNSSYTAECSVRHVNDTWEYKAASNPIAPAEFEKTIYACLAVTDAKGNITASSGVVAYSVEQYANNKINNNVDEVLDTVMKWMVIYGERAKILFNN